MNERCSDPGDHCFLVPQLISGLTGRTRELLRVAGDLDRFEQFLEGKKLVIRRPQEEGMAFKNCTYEIKRARDESMTSWINRSDEALMDMRKKPASAFGEISSESSMIPPQIQGWLATSSQSESTRSGHCWSHDHDKGSLSVELVEESLLDLFTDDVFQSVDRSHGKDSENFPKQRTFEAIEEA